MKLFDDTKNATSARTSWIEWLRIISMLWIILFHFCDYTSVKMGTADLSASWLVLSICKLGGGIGNCTFILISGYLLYEKRFKPMRLISLWMEVMFYSCFSFVVASALDAYHWDSLPELIRNFIPITGIRYWYATVYFFIYLMHPLFNMVIHWIDKKTHIALILILAYFCSLIPTISGADTMSSGGGVEIFVMMYFLGALIRKYDLFRRPAWQYALPLLLVLLMMCASEVVLKIRSNENFSYFVWPIRKLPVGLAAFLLFITFKNVKWRMDGVLKACAQSTFGIYLIHIGVLQRFFFEEVFDIAWFYGRLFFAPMLLLYAFLLFALCAAIDQFRARYLERPLLPGIEKFLQKKGIVLK